MESSGSHAWC